MRLKKDGYINRFYMWSYEAEDYDLPHSLCPYFWWLVFAVIAFIPALPGYLVALFCQGVFEKSWSAEPLEMRTKLALTFAACVVGLVLFLLGDGFYNWPWIMSTIFAVIGINVAAFYFKSQTIKDVVSEAFDVVEGKAKATKDRYCPRIEWQ